MLKNSILLQRYSCSTHQKFTVSQQSSSFRVNKKGISSTKV
jgi:hypothetical protein